MRTALALALACFGCGKVLGIVDVHPHDAGGDALIDVPGCDAGVLMATVSEDTELLPDVSPTNPDPSIRYGTYDTINVGQNNVSRVLFRFMLPQAMVDALAASSDSIEATLLVTIRASGGACTGMCPNAATTFQVYAASNAWNEGGAAHVGACWYQRFQDATMMLPWQVPGGDGASDRSQVVLATEIVSAATATAAGQLRITFPITAQARTEMMARIAANRMSLMLVPTSGGALFLDSREGLASATQLAFSVCP